MRNIQEKHWIGHATYMGPIHKRNIGLSPSQTLASLSLLAHRQQAQGRTPLPFLQAELWRKVWRKILKLGFGCDTGGKGFSFLRN